MKWSHVQWLERLLALLEISTPHPETQIRRVKTVEQNILLPVKAAFIGIIYYTFSDRPWMSLTSNSLDVTVETVQYIFFAYILITIILAAIVLLSEKLPLAIVQWTVVTSGLVDALFIASLALISGGLDSIFFWLFVALIIRNSASMPPGFPQLFSDFFVSFCYVLVGVLDLSVLANLDETTRRLLDVNSRGDEGQPFALRLMVLLLTTACCYGAQVLIERQRAAVEEATEFAAREGQLHSAGRLAAEFAHQIKNPLAIINNTAHSLRRSLRDPQSCAGQQIEIIEEEVTRADKIITQIVGYAQLSEGRVEKLNVVEEIQRAIAQVFPPAVMTPIRFHSYFAAHFPPLLMQRGHLSEILVNLLQNAREALGNKGNIFLNADCLRDHTVKIVIRDDGPGIPPDKLARIFEAYFTTKEKGTGLGLAIVKHNVELYGGTVRVESELGKGARFTVTLPAKSLPKPFVR